MTPEQEKELLKTLKLQARLQKWMVVAMVIILSMAFLTNLTAVGMHAFAG